MDVKAAARAKHASSQKGKARHSTHHKKMPASQAPPSSSSSSSSHAPPSDSTHRSESKQSSLPSNWSRYEDEEDEEAEVDPRFHDSIAVKSKGANYRELLAEKSIYQSPEMANARKRLMQARGMDILSHGSIADSIWSRDAIFNGDDSFFTLDLKLLDQELAKVDIAERLFIDRKFIPKDERESTIGQSESLDGADPFDEANTKQNRIAKFTGSKISENLGTSSKTSTMPPPHLEAYVEHGDESSLFDSEVLEPFGRGESMVSMKLDTLYQRKNLEVEAESGEVSKLSLEINSESNNVFAPEAAEAELDALLEMLDSKEASSTRHKAIEPAAYKANESVMFKGPESTAYSRAAETDVWENATTPTIGNFDQRSGGGFVQSTKAETLLRTTGVLSIAQNSQNRETSVASNSLAPSSVNPSSNLDDDFDSWLDSL